MLPLPANVEFTIERPSLVPPDPPPSYPGHLRAAYDEGQSTADADGTFRYTHVLFAEAGLAILDDFDAFAAGGSPDIVRVPDSSGTAFDVVYVERLTGILRIYLNRHAPAWPTTNL